MRILKPANKSGRQSGNFTEKPASKKSISGRSLDSNWESGDLFQNMMDDHSEDLAPTVPDAANKESRPSSKKPAVDSKKKEFNRLLGSAIRLLAMREHSRQELDKKLTGKTDRPDIVHAVLDELIEQKYQSDSRFTESFVRSRTLRGFGPIKIKSELKSKGIKINMIEEFLDANSGVWYDSAREQYDKKYGDDPVTDYNAWTKRARFMQSRGFTMEHIQVTLPSIQYD